MAAATVAVVGGPCKHGTVFLGNQASVTVVPAARGPVSVAIYACTSCICWKAFIINMRECERMAAVQCECTSTSWIASGRRRSRKDRLLSSDQEKKKQPLKK